LSHGFRAPLWAWILAAAAVALFVSLGTWQARKGMAKQAMAETLRDRRVESELISAAHAAPQGLELRRAQARGTYMADRQLLMDGQSNQHRPGYHVWTPLVLADDAAVLVDRGWIPQDRSGFDGSAPGGPVTVAGSWRSLPAPGVRLEGTANCPAEKHFPAVVLYPTHDELECLLGRPVVGGLLLMDPEAAGGYVREWTDFGFPPQRHYGYAFQWFAMAAAVLAIFFVVNRKRAPDRDARGQA